MRSYGRRMLMALTGTVFLLSQQALAEDSNQAKRGEMVRTVKVTMNYLLYLPKDYEKKSAWPLLLYLHGSGERGDNLDLLKKNGLPKLIEAGKSFPFILLAPQCPTGQAWEASTLTLLLDEIEEKYKIDRDRIYLTGLSMGGYGAWTLVIQSPDRFAAAVPISGGGEPDDAERIAHVPIWVFHGAKDPIVPIRESQEMVDALKQNGGNVKFTVYPEAKHDAWTQAYNTPELYAWLLEQKRSAKSP